MIMNMAKIAAAGLLFVVVCSVDAAKAQNPRIPPLGGSDANDSAPGDLAAAAGPGAASSSGTASGGTAPSGTTSSGAAPGETASSDTAQGEAPSSGAASGGTPSTLPTPADSSQIPPAEIPGGAGASPPASGAPAAASRGAANGQPDLSADGLGAAGASSAPPAADRDRIRQRPDAESSPEALLDDALAPPSGADRIEGEPLALTDALSARASGTTYEVLEAYWTLSTKLAAYHFALDERRRLDQIESMPGDGADSLAAARIGAELRVRQAKLAVVEAQHDLSAVLSGGAPMSNVSLTTPTLSSSSQPGSDGSLPQDVPHTGGYRTEYETLASRGVVSPTIKRIHETLPLELDVLKTHASLVEANERLLHGKSSAYRSGTDSLDTLLECHQRLYASRRAFLDSVLDYNLDIARYATLATPQNISAAQLVPMLIRNASAPRRRVSAVPGAEDGLSSVLRRSRVGARASGGGGSGVVQASGAATAERGGSDGWRPVQP